MAGAMLLAAGCSDSTVPTLAPGTTAPTAPPPTAGMTVATTTSTTAASTTSVAPSTTQTRDARFQEIQDLAQEALLGRFDAIYRDDAKALLDWVGSQKIFDGSMDAIDRSTFITAPTDDNVVVELGEVSS